MKSKLLSGIALPALLAIGAATAFAQDAPAPSPSPAAPAEKMEPAPAPAPEAAPSATPAPSPSTEAPDASADKSAAAPDAAAPAGSLSEQASTDFRSTKIVGLNVYNAANEKVGDINDLILAPDGKISAAVIGVGGFLGMGEKLVALPFSDLKIENDSSGALRATVSSSKESLETAPDFKYYAPEPEKKS